jgi:hypothetical protein
MSQGRYSQRGFAFQSFAFRTWGLAGGDGAASEIAAGTSFAEFRSRTATTETRSRTGVAEFRSRTAVARGRQ